MGNRYVMPIIRSCGPGIGILKLFCMDYWLDIIKIRDTIGPDFYDMSELKNYQNGDVEFEDY